MHTLTPQVVLLACLLAAAGCGATEDEPSSTGEGTGGEAAFGATGGRATGGRATGGAATGGAATGGAATPSEVCEEPAPWPVPASSQVVGDGTAASCTEAALRQAVTAGGHVTFDCGELPVTIAVTSQIDAADGTVVDGGDAEITLDGGGTTHILVAPDNSSLSVRNLRFVNGAATPGTMEPEGTGGAVWGRWRSRVEVRDCTFEGNTAARGGGAVAV